MTEPAPVILIGAARSGTKFLRDILDASVALARVPYDVNYIWRFGQGDVPHDHLDPAQLDTRQAQFIRSELDRQSRRKTEQALLEKTVSNTLRVPFVDAVYPDARYIHLIRDGRDVTESAMRLWQAPPDWPALWTKLRSMPLANVGYVFWFARNFVVGKLRGRKGGGVWGPRFRGAAELAATASLSTVCARQWVMSVETATADLAQIPKERVFEIRYEDLIRDASALEALVDWLNLPDADAVIERYCDQLRPAPPQQWTSLSQADRSAILETAGPLLRKLEYVDA